MLLVKTCTKAQVNTLSAKKIVDIYSNMGVLIFTYLTNYQPQPLVSAKIPIFILILILNHILILDLNILINIKNVQFRVQSRSLLACFPGGL